MAEWVKDLALSLLWLGSLLWCGFDLGTFMCRGTAPPYTHTHTHTHKRSSAIKEDPPISPESMLQPTNTNLFFGLQVVSVGPKTYRLPILLTS